MRADSSVADGPTPEMCVVAASLPILRGFISLSIIKNSRPSGARDIEMSESRVLESREEEPRASAIRCPGRQRSLLRTQSLPVSRQHSENLDRKSQEIC